MMKNNMTELVFILDRSGSMAGLESDTIGGFNSMIEKQKKQDGECYVSTVLFDNESEVLYDRMKLGDIPQMTDKDYTVRGCTALIDAIGGAIHHIGNIHKYARPEDVPEHTMFVITTDGQENASHRYTSDQVKKMIERQKEKYGWEFLFIGANIDAVETAAHYGISRDRAVNYSHITDTMRAQASVKIDRKIGGTDAQVPEAKEEPRQVQTSNVNENFEPWQPKYRKPGTGCVYQINDNLWEGSFYPRMLDGKRKKFNVYAKTREECEEALAKMIAEKKAEIAAEKAKMKTA